MAENYDTQTCRYDGKNSFVELVNSAFEIRKMLFVFSKYDPVSNREQLHIELYLSFSDALALATMIVYSG